MQEKLSRAQWQLLGGAVCAMVVAAFGPHLVQHADYHAFADQREALGVPSALNVLSNLPFLFGGLWGLWQVGRQATLRTLDARWRVVDWFAGHTAPGTRRMGRASGKSGGSVRCGQTPRTG